MLRLQLGKIHKLVKVLDREYRLPEFPEEELHDTTHRIDITGISHICQGVLASLKCLTKVVYFNLRTRHSENSLMMKTIKIDDSDAALDDDRNLLIGCL